ncbi:hypothetical protein ACRRTK_013194 [Alexandromys fortis]
MGAGDLARNAAWDRVGSGCQACFGDQAGSDSVERAGSDSPSPGRCFGWGLALVLVRCRGIHCVLDVNWASSSLPWL